MEVEFSTSSGCFGASERRRETSTTGGVEEKEEIWAADVEETIEGHINEMMRIMKTIMNQAVKIQEDIQEVKNGEKEAKATMRATARARAAAKARKRAKAKQRKQVKLDGDLDGSTEAEAISGGDVKLAGDAISGGDAITVDERMKNGDEDDSSVPVKGRDAATSIQGVELSLGGAIDGLAIYGADVYAGHKCESYASDGTFCEANVGGDNDEKYEDDGFSVSEVLPAPCDSDRIVGMCFQNVNVERVFLYFQRPPGGH